MPAGKGAARVQAGLHDLAIENDARILVPDLPARCALRHRWCWERRARPHIPTWPFAKVPRPSFSPEENARMLCVYLRPWTSDPQESAMRNPELSLLGKCYVTSDTDVPAWTQLEATGSSQSGVSGNAANVDRLCPDVAQGTAANE